MATWLRDVGERGRHVRSHDWSTSALGSVDEWPSSLQQVINVCLHMAIPAIVFWGPDLIQIYNDAAAAMLGARHPAALGASARDSNSGMWSDFGPMATRVLTSRQPSMQEDPVEITTGGQHPTSWYTLSCSPLLDDHDDVHGVLIVAFEATATVNLIRQQQRTEQDLRASEARLAAIVNKVSVGVSEIDQQGRFIFANEELCRLLGRSEERLLQMSVADVTVPEDVSASLSAVEDVLATGEVRSVDKRYQRPTGEVIDASSSLSLLRRPSTNDALLVVTVDLTERVRAQQALRESEELFRSFAEASGDLLWVRNAATLEFEYLSPAFESLYGFSRAEAMKEFAIDAWTDRIHADDRANVVGAIEKVRQGERATFEFRVLRAADDAIVWIRNTDFPIFDADGRVQRVGGIAQDITEQKQLIERQAILLAELQHRVRNTLAMIRALIQRTTAGSSSVEELGSSLLGRLAALARTQVLLTRAAGHDVDLRTLVMEELQAQADVASLTIEGEQVMLAPKAAEVLSLAVHELTTNGIKHGALKETGGQVRISWRVEQRNQQPWLKFRWQESGIEPSVLVESERAHVGFGTELITKRVPYELRGTGVLELKPSGLRCRIEFPLTSGDSILQTRSPQTFR